MASLPFATSIEPVLKDQVIGIFGLHHLHIWLTLTSEFDLQHSVQAGILIKRYEIAIFNRVTYVVWSQDQKIAKSHIRILDNPGANISIANGQVNLSTTL